jgi:hypothetical protein
MRSSTFGRIRVDKSGYRALDVLRLGLTFVFAT